MSTLAEIEAAVQSLPHTQQEELLAFLAERIRRSASERATSADAFAPIIGAFAGPQDATGRKAKDILYGSAA